MSVEFLSPQQVARYGSFVAVPSPGELEQFFRLDTAALELARSKRREHHRLGWALQWGTVRMLGTFLSDPTDVPTTVAEFVAEQLGVDDPGCLKAYGQRLPTQHEHAREIRRELGIGSFLRVRRGCGSSWRRGRGRRWRDRGRCSTGRCCG